MLHDPLSGESLMAHVQALADGIGPRPASSPAEWQAREYVRRQLAEIGLHAVEEIRFVSPDTWGYAVITPTLLSLLGSAAGRLGQPFRLLGSAASFFAAYTLSQTMRSARQPLSPLFPSGPNATLVARIPPTSGTARRTVVLVGHTDTNKHRLTFSPRLKTLLRPAASLAVAALGMNGIATLLGAKGLRRLTEWLSLVSLGSFLLDETSGFVDGANDNASAVACLLGLAAQLQSAPLRDTEVWLAFTGAEETGCVGMHALLDAYGDRLREAWFLDFEMVGAGRLAYIQQHSSLSYWASYTPDDDSLAWAQRTASEHPEFGVGGVPMTITEEVGALRSRGFRGICLAGVGADGWLVNWHQYSDRTTHIEPGCLERAARFALAMLHTLDAS